MVLPDGESQLRQGRVGVGDDAEYGSASFAGALTSVGAFVFTVPMDPPLTPPQHSYLATFTNWLYDDENLDKRDLKSRALLCVLGEAGVTSTKRPIPLRADSPV